jgi:hypothetical protein
VSRRPLRTPSLLRRALPAALLTAGFALAHLAASGSVAAAASANAWASAYGGSGNALNNPGEATITASSAPRVAEAWSTSWSSYGPTAPAVVGGVVYYLHRFINVSDPNALVAASAKTGATLWQVPLSFSNDWWFQDGVTVSGHLALMSFQVPRTFGAGLVAVDTTTHKIAWTRTVDNAASAYGWARHQVYADGTRAYVHLTDGTMSAYRLSDGALQWNVPIADDTRIGIALGAGTLYVGYDPETPGITAYATATGRKLWTAPGQGTPVVAGGRVFSIVFSTLVTVNAAGCGKATCPALWQKTFPVAPFRTLNLGASDADTVFVSYQKALPANQNGDNYAGVITRLSAATGAQQWTTSIGDYNTPPVRGGNVIWVVNEYRDNSFTGIGDRILAFAATGTRRTPLRSIPAPQHGFPQSLAVGGGTVFDQTNVYPLVGYRVA